MAMTPEERLQHDVQNGINNLIWDKVKYNSPEVAKSLAEQRGDIARYVIDELRIRWTIIERPRKQRTLRQES